MCVSSVSSRPELGTIDVASVSMIASEVDEDISSPDDMLMDLLVFFHFKGHSM
jgi:hypothetical protein